MLERLLYGLRCIGRLRGPLPPQPVRTWELPCARWMVPPATWLASGGREVAHAFARSKSDAYRMLLCRLCGRAMVHDGSNCAACNRGDGVTSLVVPWPGVGVDVDRGQGAAVATHPPTPQLQAAAPALGGWMPKQTKAGFES